MYVYTGKLFLTDEVIIVIIWVWFKFFMNATWIHAQCNKRINCNFTKFLGMKSLVCMLSFLVVHKYGVIMMDAINAMVSPLYILRYTKKYMLG